MKKQLLFILFLIVSIGTYAQCPLSVSITSVPDVSTGPVCKSTPVLLTAIQSAGAVTPVYYWIIGADTILGTDSTFVVLAEDQTVSLIMSTSSGCSPDSAFASIQIQTVLIQPTVAQITYDCSLDESDIQITSTGGTAPYTYNLVGLGVSATGAYTSVPTGTYTLYITDDQGCNDTDQVVVAPMVPTLESTPVAMITECNQTTADVLISTNGGTPSYTYDLVGIGVSTSGSYSDVPQGSYTIYTTDAQGCTDTSEVAIVPYNCPPPYPTEVITPNEDGHNDTWRINRIELYPDNEVFIFDRWGQRVYHKKGYDNQDGWDVKYLGADMPVSTYYYILKISFENSEDEVYKGPISVFR